MARVISFALGNIWRWEKSKNRDDFIKYARNLDISGVELTFASVEELLAFKLSPANEEFLKGLDYVTIHAPFDLGEKEVSEKEMADQLGVIASIYKKVKAKNVIIHPHCLPSRKILDKFNFKVSTENLRKKRKITISDFKKIFQQYPQIGFCLDVAHAYSWSKEETENLVKAFGPRITQIHFSGSYRNKDHQAMKKVTKEFLSSIEPVFKLKVPVVIEEDMRIKNEKNLKEEVMFIKEIFNK